MNWYPNTNRAGAWCACHRDGTMDECASHDDAVQECDRLNADEALADREDFAHSTLYLNEKP